jgi:hypothetical protein
MKNTVLVTGCSSGYGLETARLFHAQGWNVVATMRTPREDLLPRSERLRVVALDVTRPESIAAALEASGPIDVLVNNAGIGAFGAFEATPMALAREVFETNTFGVMAMTQAVLPQMRVRQGGVVVNVTSSVALAPMPLVAGVHREQDGDRGVHGVARPGARGVRRAREAGRAGLLPVDALHGQLRVAVGRPHPTSLRALCPAGLRRVGAPDGPDDGGGRGERGLRGGD